MLYRKNVGTKEAWARALAGALLAGYGLVQYGLAPPGLVLAASGAFTALTGVFGFCPACALVGRKPVEGGR